MVVAGSTGLLVVSSTESMTTKSTGESSCWAEEDIGALAGEARKALAPPCRGASGAPRKCNPQWGQLASEAGTKAWLSSGMTMQKEIAVEETVQN